MDERNKHDTGFVRRKNYVDAENHIIHNTYE